MMTIDFGIGSRIIASVLVMIFLRSISTPGMLDARAGGDDDVLGAIFANGLAVFGDF
jgi:hypothetical protein